MFITLLNKAPQLVDQHTLATAAAVEASIINHCRANLHFGIDTARANLLHAAEAQAQTRYDVLMEMIT